MPVQFLDACCVGSRQQCSSLDFGTELTWHRASSTDDYCVNQESKSLNQDNLLLLPLYY